MRESFAETVGRWLQPEWQSQVKALSKDVVFGGESTDLEGGGLHLAFPAIKIQLVRFIEAKRIPGFELDFQVKTPEKWSGFNPTLPLSSLEAREMLLKVMSVIKAYQDQVSSGESDASVSNLKYYLYDVAKAAAGLYRDLGRKKDWTDTKRNVIEEVAYRVSGIRGRRPVVAGGAVLLPATLVACSTLSDSSTATPAPSPADLESAQTPRVENSNGGAGSNGVSTPDDDGSLPNGLTQEQPATSVAVWRPVSVEQAMTEGIQKKLRPLPDEYQAYEQAAKDGLSLTQVASMAWESEAGYRWITYGRDEEGNIVWTKRRSGQVVGFSDYPIIFGDNFGKDHGWEYASIPNSHDATVIPGGSDGSLPMLVKGVVPLADGRQSYLHYWDRTVIKADGSVGEWKVVHGLGFGDYVTVGGVLTQRQPQAQGETFVNRNRSVDRIWPVESGSAALLCKTNNECIGIIYADGTITMIDGGKQRTLDSLGEEVDPRKAVEVPAVTKAMTDKDKQWLVIAGEKKPGEWSPLFGVDLKTGARLPIEPWETVEYGGRVWYFDRVNGGWKDAAERAELRLGLTGRELSFTGEYEGIQIPFTIGVRLEAWHYIRNISINTQSKEQNVPQLITKWWLACCWQNFQFYSGETLSFTAYLDKVRRGEGDITMAVADPLRGDYTWQNRYPMELIRYKPTQGLISDFTDLVGDGSTRSGQIVILQDNRIHCMLALRGHPISSVVISNLFMNGIILEPVISNAYNIHQLGMYHFTTSDKNKKQRMISVLQVCGRTDNQNWDVLSVS
jgi:hypothetical protein